MRSLWKGALTFGLIHIPVRLYAASAPRELKFRLLHNKDHGEIRYARICKIDGKEIPWEDIVKGYEVKDGHYIALTEEELHQFDLKKNHTIDIALFTDEAAVDTIYYTTPYYLEPDRGAASAYTLLFEALKRSKKVAVCRFIFHQHEHLGVIRPYKNALVLNQLRYDSEIRTTKDLNIPKSAVSKTELELAVKLVQELSKPFKPERYSDTYIEEVRGLIKKKAKGKKIHFKKTPPAKSSKRVDIIPLLKKSLKKAA